MKNSRKQLIAQIHLVELELYHKRKQVSCYQSQLSKNVVPILSFVAIISVLLFLFKSKNSLRKIAHTFIGAGEVLLLSYFKKQMVQLFEKN